MQNDFAIFITSHKRPHNCKSVDLLKRCKYTGNWYIVLDNTDDTIYDYPDQDHILLFNKSDYLSMSDTYVPSSNPQVKAVLYARNAVEDFAVSMGLKYFVVMDDDVVGLRFRVFDNNKLRSYSLHPGYLDEVLIRYIEYMDTAGIDCLSFGGANVFIGGKKSAFMNFSQRRACHNIFIRSTSHPIKWESAMNEDYVTALHLGNIGKLFLVPPIVQQDNTPNNGYMTNSGGMCEFYKATSSFTRSFYAVIGRPDAVCVGVFNEEFVIRVNKNNAWPKIISGRYKRRIL